MTAITPEYFLALPPEVEEELIETDIDALNSMANSLRTIAASLNPTALEPQTFTAELVGDALLHDVISERDGQVARLLTRVNALDEQIAGVLAIVKPSVSKLANEVRAFLTPEPVDEPATEPAEPLQVAAESVPGSNGSEPGVTLADAPAEDATVEVWRQFAQAVGADWPDLHHCNRSMIRSRLGLDQPVSA